jgi:hypothetical protein
MTKKKPSAAYRMAREYIRRAAIEVWHNGPDYVTFRADCRSLTGDFLPVSIHDTELPGAKDDVNSSTVHDALAKALVRSFGSRS